MNLGLGLNGTDAFTFNIEDFINTDNAIQKDDATAENKAWTDPAFGFNGVSTTFESNDNSLFANLLPDPYNSMPST